jgi:general secretion pathway protein A
MYLEYYGLDQAPFSITPDPHYVFLSEHHRDALAHLLYGIRQGGGGGFVQLTGEVGTGKTTLSRLLLNQLPENTHAALVLNPRLEPLELLQTICEELRLPIGPSAQVPQTQVRPAGKDKGKGAAKHANASPVAAKPPGAKQLFDALSAYLLEAYAKGDRVVLIIDEAQNLSTEALEQVRLLTNLETETQKLLQIILIGQPELRETLARPELRQLAQRITARYHLRPLDEPATMAYLRHRLTTAGAKRFPFTADAVRRLHRRSGGVPRLINVIAERALLGGFAHDLVSIDARTVDRAADEALAPAGNAFAHRERTPLLIAAALCLATVAIVFALTRRPANDAPPDATATTVAAAATTATQPSATPSAAASTSAAPPAAAGDALDGERLLQRLRATPTGSGREWNALVAAWKAPIAVRKASPDACLATPAPGWRCLRSRAQLDQLLQYGRPVLLRLRAEPQASWARLLGVDAGGVRLSIDGEPMHVQRIALAGVWNGEFLAIWPAPETVETDHAAGDADAVAWVRRRLQAEGLVADANGTDTAAALRTFQARLGLRSDGRLDADTVFALARSDAGPRLRTQEP